MKPCLLLVLTFATLLAGCSILQEEYDERARAECRELPTQDERIACYRAVTDREIQRRAEQSAD